MMTDGIRALDAQTRSSNTSASASTNSALSTNGFKASDFMTLLVAEIQNQDPTQPLDPTTFMGQLVQLNTLEQTMQINQVVQQYAQPAITSTSANAAS
jgi:flagellar basal-body rod modification protein FlgD